MTREEIDQMKAGRQMNELIHVHVFGDVIPSQKEMRAVAEKVWKEQPKCFYFIDCGGFVYSPNEYPDAPFLPMMPHYSTDIGTAFLVIQKYKRWQVMSQRDGIYAVIHIDTPNVQATGYCLDESAALAICKAALFAVFELEAAK